MCVCSANTTLFLTKNDTNALLPAQSGIPVPDDELALDVGQYFFSRDLFFE